MIGKKVSHFRILEKVGEGGMGVVYKAEDEQLHRHVALKVLPPDFVQDSERRQRFLREARTAAAMTHPNIATIHSVVEEGDGLYIAMELVEGSTLTEVIDGKPMPLDQVLRLATGIADGLSKAHGVNVVHRDLKPDNIIVTPDGHVKILDFGLAKIFDEADGSTPPGISRIKTITGGVTQEGRILGTVAYMSPEQARGLKIDARSDIFSFGVLLYEMATGKAPFEGETITDTLTAILRDPHPPMARFNPEAPAELERIISKCLEKDSANRYQHADELLVDLRNLRRVSDSVSLPRVSDAGLAAVEVPRPWWRNPLPLALAALVAVAAVAGGVGLWKVGAGRLSPAVQVLANSLAVLPFENLQDDGDAQRFGQILQELIITDLSGLSSLNVVSSQRLFDIQKQLGRDDRTTIDKDMATEVVARAGAGTMLTGSVSKLGEKWILTSQLVDVSSGSVMHSERIDGSDLYSMVDDLTSRIRGDLGLLATAGAGPDLAVRERTSSSIEAYQSYLEGVERLNALDFSSAVEAFENAIETDPAFGQAYYKLALARWWDRGLDAPSEGDEEAPGQVLRQLLTSSLKLSERERLLADGLLSLVEYRFDESRSRFENVVQRYPEEKEAWYGLGEAVFHAHPHADRDVALEAFEKAVALDPSFRLAYHHVFDVYEHQRRLDEVLERARTLIEADPDYHPFYGYWMRAAVQKGDEEQMKAALGGCLAHSADPGDRQRLYLEARKAYHKVGDFRRAREASQKALEADPEHLDKVLAAIGWDSLLLGDLDEADSWFRRALENDPADAYALAGPAVSSALRGEFRAAAEAARSWLDRKPGSIPARALLIEALVAAGDPKADELIESSLSSYDADAKRVELLKELAVVFVREGRPERGEKMARRAVALGTGGIDPAVHNGLGLALVHQGRVDEAKAAFERALAIAPSNMHGLTGLGVVGLLQGEYAQVEANLREVLSQGPVHSALYRFLALAIAAQDRHEDAVPHARKALKMDPGRASHALLSWLLVDGELDVAEGATLARAALDISPSPEDRLREFPFVPSPEHCLGLAELKQGRYEEATKMLERAAELRPDRASIREHLEQARAKRS